MNFHESDIHDLKGIRERTANKLRSLIRIMINKFISLSFYLLVFQNFHKEQQNPDKDTDVPVFIFLVTKRLPLPDSIRSDLLTFLYPEF